MVALSSVTTIEQVGIHLLHPHPYNQKIYGNEDISELAEHIKASKWIKPLVVSQGNRIISGHRRWQAAVSLGYTCVPVERRTFQNDDDELEALLLENQYREKTPEQRVREGEMWEDIERKKAEQRQKATLKQGTIVPVQENFPERVAPESAIKGQSRDKVAERVGFGTGRTYQKAATVVKTADKLAEEGKKEEAQALLNVLNTQSVDAAAKVVKQPEPVRAAILQTIATGKAKDVKQAEKVARQEERQAAFQKAEVHLDHCQVYTCSVADLRMHIQPASIDIIITDPPYPREFLPVYTDLGQFAAYALKPGGSLLVMIGQSYLPEILQAIMPHVPYHWTVSYLTPGGQSAQLWQKKVNTFWKPVLWFVKGAYTGEWIGDVSRSQVNDKNHHHWGQSESGMADLVERFTLPGQLVCDPFVGGGTTAVVAARLKRRFVGCDIDQACTERTLARVQEVLA